MVNNTTLSISEAGSLILSGPYLIWLEKDVFPYIFGAACLLTIILGLIFNIATYKLFTNEEHGGLKRITIQFMAIDALADVFVLAPGVYLSFSAPETLPDAYCITDGIFNMTTFLIQFGILSVGLVISLVTLAKPQVEKEHPNMCRHFCFIVCGCFSSCLLAVIPVTWEDGYVYKANEYQCGPSRSSQKAYIHVVLFLSVFLSLTLTCIVTCVLIKRFLSTNTKVLALRHAPSEETVIMDDQTRTSVRHLKDVDDHKQNMFKSNVTVSIEDHTKSYGRFEEQEPGERNRFKSDVTVSMEDETKTYVKSPFKDSTQTGVTVSMEDRTRSYNKCFNSFATESGSSVELSELGRSWYLTANYLPDITASDDELPRTEPEILDSICTRTGLKHPEHLDSADCHDSVSTINNNIVKDLECLTDSDEEISFDGSCGPGIISRAASRSSSLVSVKNDTERPKSFKKTSGQLKNENKDFLSKLLQSSLLNRNKTLKLAATYTVVSWTVLACWSPFVIMTYIDMYGTPWWGGWLTITVLCGNLSYCIKPMVILGVRGQLLKATKAVLPKSVEDRASRISLLVTQTADKVSKRLY